MYKEDFQLIKPGMIIGDTWEHSGGGYRVIQRVDVKKTPEKQTIGVSKIWFIKCTFFDNELRVFTDRSITYKHWKSNPKGYKIIPRYFFIKKLFSAR
jgi:hypothetical protein